MNKMSLIENQGGFTTIWLFCRMRQCIIKIVTWSHFYFISNTMYREVKSNNSVNNVGIKATVSTS